MTQTANFEGGESSEAVCVAVHVRPLIEQEIDQGCAVCLDVTPGSSQVGHGPQHRFTYDHVFGGDYGKDPSTLYDVCVSSLVEGLFKGYNATVFAYGQTGSGKTYTMGSAFPQDLACSYRGVIPRAMDAIFANVASSPPGIEMNVRVSFVEIHQESIRDLLTRHGGSSVQIRELPGGGIILVNATEQEVCSKEEMIAVLESGTAMRATAETGMNKRSSRSHAIFTISLEQRRIHCPSPPSPSPSSNEDEDDGSNDGEGLNDYLCAKMHLVDLAGSERVKRTKAQGKRLQEGIHINKGLLALGNVINALSEGKHHVPYRDSKLTRMLQDSLGGNSKTLMIACVSPADVNLEESLNTLRYANRARNIKNKPIVNRDPYAAQIAVLRSQLAAARAENLELRRRLCVALGASEEDVMGEKVPSLTDGGGGGGLPTAAAAAAAAAEERPWTGASVQLLKAKIVSLQRELGETRAECAQLRLDLSAAANRHLATELQKDKLMAALGDDATASAALAEVSTLLEDGTSTEVRLNKRVQELEEQVRRLQRGEHVHIAMDGDSDAEARLQSPVAGALNYYGVGQYEQTSNNQVDFMLDYDDDFEDQMSDDMEGYAQREEMNRLQSELEALQLQLEKKEASLAAVSNHAAMKQSYENQLRELQKERDRLTKERAELSAKLRALQTATAEERIRMERSYKERIRVLDQQARNVTAQEQHIKKLEIARRQAMETVRTLEQDVQSLKAGKVTLQRQLAAAAKEQLAAGKAKDKELMLLKRQNARIAAEHEREKEMLARRIKVLEADNGRKQVQLLQHRRHLQSRNGSSANTSARNGGGTNGTYLTTSKPSKDGVASAAVSSSVLQDPESRREWVEAELEACYFSHELQRQLETEKSRRSQASRQLREVERRLAALKAPEWYGPMNVKGSMNEMALLDKRKRLEERLKVHGQHIRDIQLELVQVRRQEEERGAGASDMSRWDAVLSALYYQNSNASSHTIDDSSSSGLRQQQGMRALLTTLFGSASRYKHQAHEAHEAVAEMREQLDLLRLKLQAAEVEKTDVLMRAEACGVNLRTTTNTTTNAISTSNSPAKAVVIGDNPRKDLDRQAVDILQQLDELSSQRPNKVGVDFSNERATDNGKERRDVAYGRPTNVGGEDEVDRKANFGDVDVDKDEDKDEDEDEDEDVDAVADVEVATVMKKPPGGIKRETTERMNSPLDQLKRALTGGGSMTNRLRRLAGNLGSNSIASKRWGEGGGGGGSGESEEALEYQVADMGQHATGTIVRQRSSVSAGSTGSSRGNGNGKRRAWIPN